MNNNSEEKHRKDLEVAKNWYKIAEQQNNEVAMNILKDLFPELCESEDERIRKEIIDFIQEREIVCSNGDSFLPYKKWIAWLEKQGEQNNLLNFDEAEKEKNDFVSGQFIECRKSFNEFKELESYWLEYVGDDTYIGRSDNILNQRFHITPQQLFTLFTHEHCKKYYENQNAIHWINEFQKSNKCKYDNGK